jgi:molybdate transport system ATP-binding protein
VLHSRLRPSAGERENPVAGRIAEMIALGEEARITLDVGDPRGHPLQFGLPLHVARRNGLTPGAAVTVSLLREAIHLMAP